MSAKGFTSGDRCTSGGARARRHFCTLDAGVLELRDHVAWSGTRQELDRVALGCLSAGAQGGHRLIYVRDEAPRTEEALQLTVRRLPGRQPGPRRLLFRP